MSEFVLLSTRPPRVGELSLSGTARDVVALTAWHGWLRRWGLLRAFALPREHAGELRACLIIQASGHQAAERLAGRWGRLSSSQVTVLPLSAAAGEGPAR